MHVEAIAHERQGDDEYDPIRRGLLFNALVGGSRDRFELEHPYSTIGKRLVSRIRDVGREGSGAGP